MSYLSGIGRFRLPRPLASDCFTLPYGRGSVATEVTRIVTRLWG